MLDRDPDDSGFAAFLDEDHSGASALGEIAAASLGWTESPDPLAILDGEGRLLAANPAAVVEGAPSPGGKRPMEQLLPFWADADGRTVLLEGALSENGIGNLELRLPFEGGTREKVFWVSARRVEATAGDRVVMTARNVTKKTPRARAERETRRSIVTHLFRDPVTGFLTRDAFQMLLEEALDSAEHEGRPASLLAFDLDDFTALNDTHGLAAGDEYLRRLGEAVRSRVRPTALVARLGGDEFGILHPNTTGQEAALEADHLLKLLSELSPPFEGRSLQLSASIGIAVFPDHGSKPADLMLAADMAMHQAKRRGRARFVLHDPSAKERERIGLLRSQADLIRTGLSSAAFVPVFQPITDVASGQIVAAEALVRLREGTGALAGPDTFLDAAERFGFVTAIDRVVIGSAFEALVVQRRRIAPDLELSINLSGLDFEDDSLVADISRLARAKGIRPSRITFEITETAALRDLGRVQDFTRALTAEGFRFALDDFGIGFSSFRYLRDLPMTTLKFDQSYVKDLPRKAENRVFVRGMAEICRGLGVKTVAEGVETSEIFGILRELGVERAQGWLIGHPSLDLPAPRVFDGFSR